MSTQTAQTAQPAIELHDLLIQFQKQQRFVALESGVSVDQVAAQLGHAEESILFILEAEPDKNVKQLAECIKLERSWTSRVVTSLEQRRLLKALPAPGDGRAKLLRLTPKGQQQLESAEAFVKSMMERCLAPLDAAEQRQLELLLKRLADGFGAYDYQHHAAGHPLAYQLGRLSAVTGVLGRSLFGSGLSSTQLHVFYALDDLPHSDTQVSDINRQVPADLSTVSRTLQDFERRGWAVKQQSQRDKRSCSVQLTDAGREKLAAYRSRAAEAFTAALAAFSVDEFHELCRLLAELTAALPQTDPATMGASQLTFRTVRGESETARAAELLSQMQPTAAVMRQQLGMYRNGELTGVVVIERSPDGGAISALRFAGEQLAPARCLAVLKSCLTTL